MRRETASALASMMLLAGCTSTERHATAVTNEDWNFKKTVRHQIEQCWSVNFSVPKFESMAVMVNAELEPDGSVRSAGFVDPATIESGTAAYKEFAEGALRAVLRRSPIKVPPSMPYEQWKTMTLVFSAKDMIQ